MTRLSLLIGCIAAVALCGCGKVGNLDQPAPLYGEKAKTDYQAKKQAAAAAKAKKQNDEPDPIPDKPYDPTEGLANQRALPVPGTNPDPSRPAPPGVLPDPFNYPQ